MLVFRKSQDFLQIHIELDAGTKKYENLTKNNLNLRKAGRHLGVPYFLPPHQGGHLVLGLPIDSKEAKIINGGQQTGKQWKLLSRYKLKSNCQIVKLMFFAC